MRNIAFIGNSQGPAKLLELFRPFTPGKSGVWGNLRGVDNYREADYFAVIDYLPNDARAQGVAENDCIFLGAHPESMQAYKNMDAYKGLAHFDCKNTFGFGEWWLKYDYDYLAALQPMTKTKELACIMSDANSQPYHTKRRAYLERFCNSYANQIDVYGRLKPWGSIVEAYKGHCGVLRPGAKENDHMSGKESVYETYKYALEFDGTGKYYFSERIFDCMLLWCMPIYWGGESLHLFLPEKSFKYLNINNDGTDVMNAIMRGGLYEEALPHIAKARDLLLNHLQIWPRVHAALYGTNN